MIVMKFGGTSVARAGAIGKVGQVIRRFDRLAGAGMSVSVGWVRACPVPDLRLVALVHNTIRGAAGAAILNAGLLKARGLL